MEEQQAVALTLVVLHSGVAQYGTLLLLAGEWGGEGQGEVGRVGEREGGGRADYGRRVDEADHAGTVVVVEMIPGALLPFLGSVGSCVSGCFHSGSAGWSCHKNA